MHVVWKLFGFLAQKFASAANGSSSVLIRDGRRGVGMFSSKVNPVTGTMEWVPNEDKDMASEACDLSHELARSQYGDMLHDTIRASPGNQHTIQ